ncbi:MAG TPA: lytic transglycosylase domain-containing protein [Chitinophagaceae bacterium]|nr:lytic transglycosylase domain-containing protein [Chitinophagaceae bacterium]
MFRSILHKAVFVFVLLSLVSLKAICHQERLVNTVRRTVSASSKFKQDFTRYMAGYVKQNREVLQNIKRNKAASFKVIDATFKKYNLPSDLKYLAVVESELKASAVSKVGAVGFWQLMPETAQLLGLKVSAKYDERKHLSKSTQAAAIYLRDLHREFGDWLLVLAAYNSGPGPVYKAIRKSGSRDFWKLQAYLPAETRAHVKRIIATRYYFEGQADDANFMLTM